MSQCLTISPGSTPASIFASASVQQRSSCQPGELVNCEGDCAAQDEGYEGGGNMISRQPR